MCIIHTANYVTGVRDKGLRSATGATRKSLSRQRSAELDKVRFCKVHQHCIKPYTRRALSLWLPCGTSALHQGGEHIVCVCHVVHQHCIRAEST